MTDFSGASGRAEFFTYLTFAAVAGPGLGAADEGRGILALGCRRDPIVGNLFANERALDLSRGYIRAGG